jgi:membrane protease YdiL (CAAX protease family)
MAASPLRSRAVPGPRDPTRGGRDRPLGTFGAVVAAYVGANLVAILLVGVSGAAVNSSVYNTLIFVGLWTGFIGVPVYLSRTRGTGRLSADFGLRFGGPIDVGLGVGSGLLAFGMVEGYARLIKALGDHADLGHEATVLSGHGLGLGFVVFGLCAAVGAPIAEELYFRGLTQPVLQRYLGQVGGVAVTAVAFGFVHLGSSNPIEVVFPLTVFGAIVGVLAWRTGRLGPGIIAHMTFNGITVVALALSR